MSPFPSERARKHEPGLLPGEKVADVGGRMRGYLLMGKGKGEKIAGGVYADPLPCLPPVGPSVILVRSADGGSRKGPAL
jgi:hypothetical protein